MFKEVYLQKSVLWVFIHFISTSTSMLILLKWWYSFKMLKSSFFWFGWSKKNYRIVFSDNFTQFLIQRCSLLCIAFSLQFKVSSLSWCVKVDSTVFVSTNSRVYSIIYFIDKGEDVLEIMYYRISKNSYMIHWLFTSKKSNESDNLKIKNRTLWNFYSTKTRIVKKNSVVF